jgi:hypothetical protein
MKNLINLEKWSKMNWKKVFGKGKQVLAHCRLKDLRVNKVLKFYSLQIKWW